MKTKLTTIILAVSLCAALLSGCGGNSSLAIDAPSAESSYTAETLAPSTAAEAHESESNSQLLGIIVDNGAPMIEEYYISLCKDLGQNFADYDDWYLRICNSEEEQYKAANEEIDNGCTTLIFHAKGSMTVAEQIQQEFPNIRVLIAEAENDFVENVSVPDTKLSDGPIFIVGNQSGFNLTHYALESGKRTVIFDFHNPGNKYSLAQITPGSSFQNRHLFDTKFSRLAITWTENSDASNHVGWIDKNGVVTDITNIIHPTTSGYQSVTPHDVWAMFTNEDIFVFFDRNTNEFYYFDSNANEIVDSYKYEDNFRLDREVVLDLDNRPHQDWLVNFGGYLFSVGSDYALYDDGGIVFFSIGNQHNGVSNAIIAFGPGISEMTGSTAHYDFNTGIPITPSTEFRLDGYLAYCRDNICFTAQRGNERKLFKISYVNYEPSDPVLVEDIDNSWGNIFTWSDSDAPAFSIDANENIIQKAYIDIKGFVIEGKWKNVGTYTFGQVDNGGIVSFDGTYCNLYSPRDTYALYKDGDSYRLDTTSLLGEPTSFTVKIVDKDNIDVYYGSNYLELTRVN